MRVLKIEPGKAPITINIENTLESLQGQVGGYIEILTFSVAVAVVMDRDHKEKDKPYNLRLFDDNLLGVLLIAGRNGEDLCDIGDEDAKWWNQWWRTLRWGDGR